MPNDHLAPLPDLADMPKVPAGLYRHYKGNLYALIDVVRHSETLELLALYRPMSAAHAGAGALWVRPWAMFFETVLVDGVAQPRFQGLDQPGSSS